MHQASTPVKQDGLFSSVGTFALIVLTAKSLYAEALPNLTWVADGSGVGDMMAHALGNQNKIRGKRPRLNKI